MASKMEKRINEVLNKYLELLEKYLNSGKAEASEINTIAGAFEYIVNPQDFVPDDIPNVGYLDDLLVVLEVSNSLVKDAKINISSDEHSKIVDEFNKQKALLYNIPVDISVSALTLRGQSVLKTKSWQELFELAKKDIVLD